MTITSETVNLDQLECRKINIHLEMYILIKDYDQTLLVNNISIDWLIHILAIQWFFLDQRNICQRNLLLLLKEAILSPLYKKILPIMLFCKDAKQDKSYCGDISTRLQAFCETKLII